VRRDGRQIEEGEGFRGNSLSALFRRGQACETDSVVLVNSGSRPSRRANYGRHGADGRHGSTFEYHLSTVSYEVQARYCIRSTYDVVDKCRKFILLFWLSVGEALLINWRGILLYVERVGARDLIWHSLRTMLYSTLWLRYSGLKLEVQVTRWTRRQFGDNPTVKSPTTSELYHGRTGSLDQRSLQRGRVVDVSLLCLSRHLESHSCPGLGLHIRGY
jgi:hypothetical protein